MAGFDLGSIRATMGLDESNFTRGLLNAQNASQIFGQNVVNFVNNPLLGTVSILKNVGGAIAQSVRETAFANQELLRISSRIGANVELVSALRGAYKGFGQDAGAVERQLTKLNQQIGEAASGNLAAKQNFDALGVAIRDTAGKARDINDIFPDVVDGLGALENHSRRVAIAQKIFGEDASRVIDIIGRGTGVLKGFTDEARKLGEVYSSEKVGQADQFANAIDKTTRAIAGLKEQLSQGLISGFVGPGFDSQSIEQVSETLQNKFVPVAEEAGRKLRTILDLLDAIRNHDAIAFISTIINSNLSNNAFANPLAGVGVNPGGLGQDLGARVRQALSQNQRQIRAFE